MGAMNKTRWPRSIHVGIVLLLLGGACGDDDGGGDGTGGAEGSASESESSPSSGASTSGDGSNSSPTAASATTPTTASATNPTASTGESETAVPEDCVMPPLPDGSFDAVITGALGTEISLELPMQVFPATGAGFNGGYVSVANLLQMTVIGEPNTSMLGLATDEASGVEVGSYSLGNSDVALSAYNDISTGDGWITTSGTLNITRVRPFCALPDFDFYMDGDFVIDAYNEAQDSMVHIEGDFTAVNMKAN